AGRRPLRPPPAPLRDRRGEILLAESGRGRRRLPAGARKNRLPHLPDPLNPARALRVVASMPSSCNLTPRRFPLGVDSCYRRTDGEEEGSQGAGGKGGALREAGGD